MELVKLIENAPLNLKMALNSTVRALFSAAGNDHPYAVEVQGDFDGFVQKNKKIVENELVSGYQPGTSYYLFKEETDAVRFVKTLNSAIHAWNSYGRNESCPVVGVKKFTLPPQILISRFSPAQKEELKQSIRGLYNQAAQPVPENLDDVIKTGIDGIVALQIPSGQIIEHRHIEQYREQVAGAEVLEYVEAKLKGQEYEP